MIYVNSRGGSNSKCKCGIKLLVLMLNSNPNQIISLVSNSKSNLNVLIYPIRSVISKQY